MAHTGDAHTAWQPTILGCFVVLAFRSSTLLWGQDLKLIKVSRGKTKSGHWISSTRDRLFWMGAGWAQFLAMSQNIRSGVGWRRGRSAFKYPGSIGCNMIFHGQRRVLTAWMRGTSARNSTPNLNYTGYGPCFLFRRFFPGCNVPPIHETSFVPGTTIFGPHSICAKYVIAACWSSMCLCVTVSVCARAFVCLWMCSAEPSRMVMPGQCGIHLMLEV